MRQGKERSARGEVKEKERNGEGQSENKLRAGAKWTGCRSTLRALYQVNLHSPLPLLLFQSVTGGSVTNTFFHPSLPRAPSPSSTLPLTFPSSPPHSLCLTSFLFISVSNSPQLPSLNRTVCLFDGLRLPLAALNLLSTARGVSIWRGFFRIDFYFFFAIVCKKWKCVKYSKHILYVESSYISIFKQTCR